MGTVYIEPVTEERVISSGETHSTRVVKNIERITAIGDSEQ